MIIDGLCKRIPYPLPKADQDVLKQSARETSCRQGALEAMRVCQPPFRCWTW